MLGALSRLSGPNGRLEETAARRFHYGTILLLLVMRCPSNYYLALTVNNGHGAFKAIEYIIQKDLRTSSFPF